MSPKAVTPGGTVNKRVLFLIAVAFVIAVPQLKPQTPTQPTTPTTQTPQQATPRRGGNTGTEPTSTVNTQVGTLAEAPAPGRIQGVVVREGTSDPIVGVTVTVNGAGGAGGGNRGGNRGGGNRGNNRGANAAPAPAAPAIPAAADAVPDPFTTTTNGTGQFSFIDVPPGNRTITAQLDGYFSPSPNGSYGTSGRTSVTVVSQQIADARIGLIPGGTISGRVYDANGMPTPDAQVQAMRFGYQDGVAGVQQTTAKTTDDRGEFRIYRLPPGDYYIAATPRQVARGGRGNGGNGANATPAALPVRTFYPDVTDPSRAVLMTLHGGDELSGSNITLRAENGATLSGQITSALPAVPVVTGGRGQRGANTGAASTLTLTPHDKNSANSFSNTATISMAAPTSGKFQIRNVPPGIYDLLASLPDATGIDPNAPAPNTNGQRGQRGQGGQGGQRGQSTTLGYGRATVEVRGSDVDGIAINIHPGTDVNGRITVDGGSQNVQDVRIALQSVDSASRLAAYQQIDQIQTVVDTSGNFKIPAVPDGRYQVQVTYANGPVDPTAAGNRGGNRGAGGGAGGQGGRGARGGGAGNGAGGGRGGAAGPLSASKAYVEDIRQGSLSVYDNGLLVGGQASTEISVMIATEPAALQGTVVGANQKPAAQTMVVLVPATNRRQNTSLYKTATSDANGKFTMNGIAPGQYELFSWQDMIPGAYENPGYLQRYDGRGTVVSLIHGATLMTEVHVIPAEGR